MIINSIRIPRMWSDKGRDVVKSVANYVGGKRR